MPSPYDGLMFLLCLAASTFFSGSEAVLMSLVPERTKQLSNQKGPYASLFNYLSTRQNELLVTILIGNNVANIGAASLSATMAAQIFDNRALGISIGITTILILFVGEIIPKTVARNHSESLIVPVLRILQSLNFLLTPLIWAVMFIIKKMLGPLAVVSGRLITQSDIEYLVERAEEDKTIDSKQIELLNSILEFPTIKVKDIMIPRSKIKFLKKEAPFEEVMQLVGTDLHTRYPVCEGELETILGFIHVKDLAFIRGKNKETFSLEKIVKRPFFVYEQMKIQAVFDYMNREKVHMAFIKDETGLIVGLITLEDIIEEILGDIIDEHDDEEDINLNSSQKIDWTKGILLDADISIRELDSEYNLELPLSDSYSTFAGFLLSQLEDDLCVEGKLIEWNDLIFELKEVEESQIKKVFIKRQLKETSSLSSDSSNLNKALTSAAKKFSLF